MTTTNRMRAGTYYGCAPSGCNGPKEGECLSLCLHRAMPIDFVSSDEEEDLAAERERLIAYQRGMRNAIPAGEPKSATEFAAPEPLDLASFRPLVAAGLVVLIAALFAWWRY